MVPFFHIIIIVSFIVVLGGDTLWHLQRFLHCIKYFILEFICSTTPLYHALPDSRNSYNRYHYCIYMHVYTFFASYSPSYLLSLLPSPFTLMPTLPPEQDLFQSPVLWFCRKERGKDKKENKWRFCSFEINVAIQGVFLWYFHIYLCYSLN
jgi:hypothetical protein